MPIKDFRQFIIILLFAGLVNLGFSASLPKTCASKCVRPFGSELGKNADVIAYSNCNTDCISEQSSAAIKNVYSGMSWQCVEYARRWLIQVNQHTFGDVDNAQQIWDIEHVTGVGDSKKYKFISKPNPNRQAPEIGDLMIYKIALPDFPYGHVAVIVDVNSKAGYVDIAEQNYTNNQWMDTNQYARRIILVHHHGKYQLIDKDYANVADVSVNGVIIGWKHVSKK